MVRTDAPNCLCRCSALLSGSGYSDAYPRGDSSTDHPGDPRVARLADSCAADCPRASARIGLDAGRAVGRSVPHDLTHRWDVAGVAAVHLEDQVLQKRCGHRPGKQVVSVEEMCDRIRAGVDARWDRQFTVMARTDAVAGEGLEKGLERAQKYVAAGADAIFAEALQSLDDYRIFTEALSVPVLANLTEFGKTPLFTLEEMRASSLAMVLYPLTAFRMMNAAALRAYATLREAGTQKALIDEMQTREDLYGLLDYYRYEELIDRLYGDQKQGDDPHG
ncbi:MAG: isocitrate lyase/phosphoenolpyruvate mutase family protein [bacterium]|nr:isocitrate lyase/phosphoenolpyruvate mutase family protein [bacterium]